MRKQRAKCGEVLGCARTNVRGKPQLRIADRTVIKRASFAQSCSGKLRTPSTVEYERTRPLHLRYQEQDRHQEQNVLSLRAIVRHRETIRRREMGFESE
jgi:hypothetical protein